MIKQNWKKILGFFFVILLIVISCYFFCFYKENNCGGCGATVYDLESDDTGAESLVKINNSIDNLNTDKIELTDLTDANIPNDITASNYQTLNEHLTDLSDGTLTKTKVQDYSNWDTAYGWGDHSSQGYLSSNTIATTTTVCLSPQNCEFQADGTADNVQIQAAIDSLTSGGMVHIAAGTYDIASRIIILTSDIIVKGDGQATKLILDDNVNTEIIVVGNAVDSVNNVSFYDLYLDGNKQNNSSACGYSGCTKNLLRYRSDAQNSYGGIIDNVYATNGAQNGLSFESHAYCTMRNNIATNNDNFGLWAENGSNFKIIGNDTASNTMAGIKVLSAGGMIVSNNNSKGDFGNGIALQSVSGVVSNNIIYRAGWASTHQSAATGIGASMCSNLNIIGNNIYGAYGDGMSLNEVTKSVISGNVFRRNGQAADNTYSDISLNNTTGACTDNVFTNNTFKNDSAAYYDNVAKYNIEVDAGDVHVRNYFGGNVFGEASTSAIHALDIEGGGSVEGNSFGNNINLNQNGFYNYGYFDENQTIDPGIATYIKGTGYYSTTNLTVSNGIYEGQEFTLQFNQDSGSKSISWASNVKFAGGSVTLSSGASDVDILKFIWDGTNWNETSRSLDVN